MTDDVSDFVTYRFFADGAQVTEHVNGCAETRVVVDRDFVYGTANENTFTVKAVDQAGNTSEASNAATDVC